MRIHASALAIVLCQATAVSAAPAKHVPATLGQFTFMGQSPETLQSVPVVDSKGQPCEENKDVAGDVTCNTMRPKIGGVEINFIMQQYYKGRLYRVFGDGPDGQYAEVLAAFTAKYGMPKLSSTVWQSKGGAKYDNAVATWRFRDGILRLDQLGLDRDSFSFAFDANINQPPLAKPKIDF